MPPPSLPAAHPSPGPASRPTPAGLSGPSAARATRRRGWVIGTGCAAGLALAIGVAESRGWPFLADPAARWLAAQLGREVQLADGASRRFSLRLVGGIELQVARMRVGNASWSRQGPMVDVRDLRLAMRWRDLLRLRGDGTLRLQRLAASSLELRLQRRADGRASWRVGHADGADGAGRGPHAVRVASLQLPLAQVDWDDAMRDLRLHIDITGPDAAGGAVDTWRARASGQRGGDPVEVTATAGATLGGVALGEAGHYVPVTIDARVGRAHLAFDGSVHDPRGQARWDGGFELTGPSLASVGRPLGLTLPTTRPFKMVGRVQQQGGPWEVEVVRATVGRSELAGQFTYTHPDGARPRLAGQLRSRVLWVADLGPAIGVDAAPGAARASRPAERVLPDRALDIASLSRMDAEVTLALDRVDWGSPHVQPWNPMHAVLRLQDGVLTLADIDARSAGGRLAGEIRLDGRVAPAAWQVDLTMAGLRLERWLLQPRRPTAPPWATGRVDAHVQLTGAGRSVADMLAVAEGRAWGVVTRGQVSHLALEVAGLDVAQALGVALRGDDALALDCAAADLRVARGLATPAVLLLDTRDSTVWAEGTASLADERLDLVARVAPKDVSPLALRAPLRVRGSFARPRVSIERGPLLRRVVPAALLALVHPLLGLLPLADASDGSAASPAAAACRRLLRRS